jgi:hypothetical protein
MDGAVRVRVPRITALLAAVLCGFALLAPPSADTAAGAVNTGNHLVKVVTAGAAHQQTPTLRLDQPPVLGTEGQSSVGRGSSTATATSAEITTSCTVDSPRTRGPPEHGCC